MARLVQGTAEVLVRAPIDRLWAVAGEVLLDRTGGPGDRFVSASGAPGTVGSEIVVSRKRPRYGRISVRTVIARATPPTLVVAEVGPVGKPSRGEHRIELTQLADEVQVRAVVSTGASWWDRRIMAIFVRGRAEVYLAQIQQRLES